VTPDEAWTLQTTHCQLRYREWPCNSRRSRPCGQPCGSPKSRNFPWPASAVRGLILPCDLAAGPQVCRGSRGCYCLSAQMGPIHHTEGWAHEAADPLERAMIRQLLTLEEIGNCKLSQFLRHLRGLAPDVPEDFLSTIWSSQLPPTYRPTSLVSQSAAWTLQRAMRTASLRS
jgi:hypothetical protein